MNIALLLGNSHWERLGVFRGNHTMKKSLRLNFTLEMIILVFSSFSFEFYFNENKMCLYGRKYKTQRGKCLDPGFRMDNGREATRTLTS